MIESAILRQLITGNANCKLPKYKGARRLKYIREDAVGGSIPLRLPEIRLALWSPTHMARREAKRAKTQISLRKMDYLRLEIAQY